MAATKFLRDYQVVDLAFLMQNDKSALLHDPGAGKTGPVCVFAYYSWHEKNKRTAFVMPKSLLKKNREEMLAFTDFVEKDVVIIDGTPKQREKQIASNAKVFLMGFDRWSADWQILIAAYPDMKVLLVDEIHLGYSTMKAKRTQSFVRSAQKMDHFVAMTGTIIAGRLDSAYPTIHVIEPRYYGSFEAFMSFHAERDEYGRVLYWKNHDKIAAIFGKHSIKRSFESIFGKQEPQIIPEIVEMAEEQRKKYDEFADKAILELENSFLDGSLGGGVFTMRCRQIMQCPELFDLCKGERTGKDERLLIHLADHKNTGDPLTIFSTLIPEHNRISELLTLEGFTFGVINGEVPAPKRSFIDEQYRTGNIQVLLATPQTAGIGFNWEHAFHAIFTSLDYRDDSFDQAVRRHIRGVLLKALRITVLEYENSIDQDIMRIVERKSLDAHKVDPSKTRLKFHK